MGEKLEKYEKLHDFCKTYRYIVAAKIRQALKKIRSIKTNWQLKNTGLISLL